MVPETSYFVTFATKARVSRDRPRQSFPVTLQDTTCSTGLAVVGFIYAGGIQRVKETERPLNRFRSGCFSPARGHCRTSATRRYQQRINTVDVNTFNIQMRSCLRARVHVGITNDRAYGDVKRRKTWRNGLVLDPGQSVERNAFALSCFPSAPYFFCQLFEYSDTRTYAFPTENRTSTARKCFFYLKLY